MHKTRLLHGKHPIVLKDKTLLNKLARLILKVDPNARIIPARFNRRRGKKSPSEALHSHENPKVIFIKIYDKQYVQRLKIECSQERTALKLLEHIQSFIRSDK